MDGTLHDWDAGWDSGEVAGVRIGDVLNSVTGTMGVCPTYRDVAELGRGPHLVVGTGQE